MFDRPTAALAAGALVAGTALAAEDSANAQKTPFAGIEAVEVTDALTVRVTLTSPDGNFPFNMDRGDAVIVAPESIRIAATNPIGAGEDSPTQANDLTVVKWLA